MAETESTEWLNRNPGQTKTEKGEEAKKEKNRKWLSLSLSISISSFLICDHPGIRGNGRVGLRDYTPLLSITSNLELTYTHSQLGGEKTCTQFDQQIDKNKIDRSWQIRRRNRIKKWKISKAKPNGIRIRNKTRGQVSWDAGRVFKNWTQNRWFRSTGVRHFPVATSSGWWIINEPIRIIPTICRCRATTPKCEQQRLR